MIFKVIQAITNKKNCRDRHSQNVPCQLPNFVQAPTLNLRLSLRLSYVKFKVKQTFWSLTKFKNLFKCTLWRWSKSYCLNFKVSQPSRTSIVDWQQSNLYLNWVAAVSMYTVYMSTKSASSWVKYKFPSLFNVSSQSTPSHFSTCTDSFLSIF